MVTIGNRSSLFGLPLREGRRKAGDIEKECFLLAGKKKKNKKNTLPLSRKRQTAARGEI